MKSLLLALVCAGAAIGKSAVLAATPPLEPDSLEQEGRFREAGELFDRRLRAPGLSEQERRDLEFERERLDRIRRDYPYTLETLYPVIHDAVAGLTRAEFDGWVRDGWFDSREIEGVRRFMGSSVSNLFFRRAELNPRRTPPRSTAALARQRWETCVAIQNAARAAHQPYVLPKRFRATMAVDVQADSSPPAGPIRAWLPVPRRYPFQRDFALLATSSPVRHLADETSPARALYLEQTPVAGSRTRFTAEYLYTAWGVSFDIHPSEVTLADPLDPTLEPWLREAPHVVFTPAVRELSRQILAGETNPAVKARKCFEWIADNIRYSYAVEYSTIRNISDYCLTHRYGDCGQEALLFITLCRLNGVPARWQSGWNTFPGEHTIHDWAEIYLAPYGWVPVDPYMGVFAMRYADGLAPEQRRLIRDFHFGGLDQYRMSANSDHSQILQPAKSAPRSDNVDFQRGEVESGGKNIYFDRFSYSLTVSEQATP